MVKYEILEHPSELRIKVYGKTLKELFSNAVLAMAEIMSKELGIRSRKLGTKETMKIESVDLNSLLVDFLSEVLARSQINKAVYMVDSIRISCHSEFISESHNFLKENSDEMPKQVRHDDKDERCVLESRIIGHPVGHFDEDIKAVTYEDLDIKKVDNVWQTIIVFDI